MSGVLWGEGRKCWWWNVAWLSEPAQVPRARTTSPRFPRELNVTFMLILRGTKRKLRASQQSSIRRIRKGFPGAAVLEQEADACQMLASTVWRGGGPLGPAFTFRGHLMSLEEMVCVQALDQPKDTTLGLKKDYLPLTEALLCAGPKVNMFPCPFILLAPLRRHYGHFPGEETKALGRLQIQADKATRWQSRC